MRLNLIEFGVPGPLSGIIYTYDEIIVPVSVELKILDIRETSYEHQGNLKDFTLGECKLEKDADGIWITEMSSSIEITDDLLSKSSDRYWMGSVGRVENKFVKDAEVLFVYISVEEDIKPLVRDLRLNEMGL